MPHWSCSSVLCYNNYATVSESGAKMGKYKLPSDPETQAAYMRIFRTTETFDWEKGYKGFSIQDLCAIKGVTLNRPKQKDAESGKFTQPECHQHFSITSTRIHVERFIGRVRNWRILNCVWPMNRIDLLAPTWQVLCHTVNLLFPPIGPTEDTIMVEETTARVASTTITMSH